MARNVEKVGGFRQRAVARQRRARRITRIAVVGAILCMPLGPLAAVTLGGCLNGIERQLSPGAAGPEGAADHASLPRNWQDAITCFAASDRMRGILGAPLHDGFAAIKQAEHDQLALEVTEVEWRLYGFVV